MKDKLRLKICKIGVALLEIFLISVIILTAAAVIEVTIFDFGFSDMVRIWKEMLIGGIAIVISEALIFWAGIICVYLTSVQLGIKIRVIGALVGFIPIANIIALVVIIRTVSGEIRFESERIRRNENRRDLRICDTRYPILMVHGVFFRDYKFPNYWGRIPKELKTNGARIYFGNQQSASSVADSGRELAGRIKKIVSETGCGKLNVIAHSKGGLDIRYAMNYCGISEMIASVTTINTPHRGCKFAEYLLEKLPESMQKIIADSYDATMRKLGDQSPDFMKAVTDLTASECSARDAAMKAPEGVFCQSVGSKLNKASGGRFPLNFSYNLVKYFDGPNDGLVSEDSFSWGEKYTFLKTDGKRGISHGDMIDLNRENIPDFDVREFYVRMTAELKERGL